MPLHLGGCVNGGADGAGKVLDLVAVCINKVDLSCGDDEDVLVIQITDENAAVVKVLDLLKDGNAEGDEIDLFPVREKFLQTPRTEYGDLQGVSLCPRHQIADKVPALV